MEMGSGFCGQLSTLGYGGAKGQAPDEPAEGTRYLTSDLSLWREPLTYDSGTVETETGSLASLDDRSSFSNLYVSHDI